MKRNSLWTLLLLLLSLSMILAAAGCGPAPTEEAAPTEEPVEEVAEPEVEEPAEEEPAEEQPVILRVGVLTDLDCWNPFTCSSIWFQGRFATEGFTGFGSTDSGCEGVPRLAESWEVSEDGLTWTIILHEGITFSDGTPFDAEAAKWNFEWYANSPSLSEWYAEIWSLESVEVIDDLTFSYTTTDPIINSPDYDWIWWSFLPPSVWADISEEELYEFENYPPIGTGPYVVTEHVPGSHIIFDAREDYYLGKPPIDRVVLAMYTNVDAIVSALLGGDIDATTHRMPPETYDTLAADPNVTVEETEPYAGVLHWLVFNLYEGGNKHPAIDDPAVREAIDYAINKEQIVEVALLGHGAVLPTGWIGKTDVELNPEIEVTPYDPDKANQILDDAGYADTDGDGIRETPDGEPLEFRFIFQQENPEALTITDLLSMWLEQIGIALLPEALELGSWFPLVLDDHDYDLFLDSETHDIDASSMDFWFSCWSAESGSNALNYPGYCNPEMDDLVAAYWFNNDPEARWEPMYEAQKIFAEDRPLITLAGQNRIQAYRNDRFEFPKDTCDVSYGIFDPEALMEAVVK